MYNASGCKFAYCGLMLTLKVEPNQELKGLVCHGANVLPTRVVEDAFKQEYGNPHQ